MNDRTPEKALIQLLHDLFDAEELRGFLCGLDDGERLAAVLAGDSASDERLFSGAVAMLKRRGLIGRDFFAALVQERPRQAGRVAEVERGWTQRDHAPRSHFDPALHTPDRSPREVARPPEAMEPSQPGGQHIDNRGASIGQQISVQGDANFTFGAALPVPKR